MLQKCSASSAAGIPRHFWIILQLDQEFFQAGNIPAVDLPTAVEALTMFDGVDFLGPM